MSRSSTLAQAVYTLLGAAFFVLPLASAQVPGNTTCKDPSVTWYNNPDGLNPCEMYGKLRAICDNGYTVPTMDRALPPDTCRSQMPICCCNSVAFNIAMMCLQCQQGVGTGVVQGDNGIDAPPQTMQKYWAGCNTGPNGVLPAQVQNGVCRTGLKLMKYQYNPFWSDGAWFLQFTRGVANNQTATSDLDTGLCINTDPTTTTLPSASFTPSPSASSSSTQLGSNGNQTNGVTPVPKDGVSTALIGGVVAGVVGILIMLAIIAWLVVRERRRRAVSADQPGKWAGHAAHPQYPSMGTVGSAAYATHTMRTESSIPYTVPSGMGPASSVSGAPYQPPPSQQVAEWVGASGQGVSNATSAYRVTTGKGGVRRDAAPVSRQDDFEPSPPRYDEAASPHWGHPGFHAVNGSAGAGGTSRSMSPDAARSTTGSGTSSGMDRVLSPGLR